MDAYSLDLRGRVAAACDEGSRSRSEVAEDFGVSVSFITKLLQRRRSSGGLAARPHAGGFASALDAEAMSQLRSLVDEQPDATLAELSVRLAGRQGVSRSVPVVCRALKRLGLRRKKRRCAPRSGTRRACGVSAGLSSRNSAVSRRASASYWTSAARRRR
jgi:transposase